MSRVYVVQLPRQQEGLTGQLVPKYDLTPARRFGQLVELFSPTARPDSLVRSSMLYELKSKLCSFSDADYLLLVGSPVLIGVAVAVAAGFNRGRVRILQWDKRQQDYLPVEVDMEFLGDVHADYVDRGID